MALSSSPKSLEIKGITITLRRHPSTRSLKLRVDPLTKQPILSVPLKLSFKYIEFFLERHHEWMVQQLKSFTSALQPEEVLFQGKVYQLIHRSFSKKTFTVEVDHLQRHLCHNSCTDLIFTRLKPFFKRQALKLLEEKCDQFASSLGVSFKSIHLKDYKGRWGSCSSQGDLSFSWRLILAPPEVLTYLCAHETAHLIHMNHSKEFWHVVSSLFPAYKNPKQWLKDKGKILFHQF